MGELKSEMKLLHYQKSSKSCLDAGGGPFFAHTLLNMSFIQHLKRVRRRARSISIWTDACVYKWGSIILIELVSKYVSTNLNWMLSPVSDLLTSLQSPQSHKL